MVQFWLVMWAAMYFLVGKTSNFAVVMATLYINGKSYGMHGFLTQLRSLETHEPMPGTTLLCSHRIIS